VFVFFVAALQIRFSCTTGRSIADTGFLADGGFYGMPVAIIAKRFCEIADSKE